MWTWKQLLQYLTQNYCLWIQRRVLQGFMPISKRTKIILCIDLLIVTVVKAIFLVLSSYCWYSTVEPVLKNYPSGHKKCGLSRQVAFGDWFSYIEIQDILPGICGLFWQVVGLSRKISLYYHTEIFHTRALLITHCHRPVSHAVSHSPRE